MNPNHRRFDAAIIDLDGTLVDTLGDFAAALNLVMADLALPAVDRVTVGQFVGKGSEYLIKSVLIHVQQAQTATDNIANDALSNSAENLYPIAWQRYQQHYAAINGQYSEVFPGALEGLNLLKSRGLKLACVTNKPTLFAVALLESKGLAGFFEVSFGGDAFERKKPHPQPLLKSCEALGAAPSRTLMVGDSSNDAQAARAAGCPVVLVTYGYNHGEPVAAVDADGFVESLADLGRFI